MSNHLKLVQFLQQGGDFKDPTLIRFAKDMNLSVNATEKEYKSKLLNLIANNKDPEYEKFLKLKFGELSRKELGADSTEFAKTFINVKKINNPNVENNVNLVKRYKSGFLNGFLNTLGTGLVDPFVNLWESGKNILSGKATKRDLATFITPTAKAYINLAHDITGKNKNSHDYEQEYYDITGMSDWDVAKSEFAGGLTKFETAGKAIPQIFINWGRAKDSKDKVHDFGNTVFNVLGSDSYNTVDMYSDAKLDTVIPTEWQENSPFLRILNMGLSEASDLTNYIPYVGQVGKGLKLSKFGLKGAKSGALIGLGFGGTSELLDAFMPTVDPDKYAKDEYGNYIFNPKTEHVYYYDNDGNLVEDTTPNGRIVWKNRIGVPLAIGTTVVAQPLIEGGKKIIKAL